MSEETPPQQEQPAKSLLVELATGAARDLATFMDNKNPNCEAAGRAALRELNAIIRCATTARDALLRDLHDPNGQPLKAVTNGKTQGPLPDNIGHFQ